MVRLLSASFLAAVTVGLGAGAYACSSNTPASSEDSGVPSGSSSGGTGSSSGVATGSSSGVASGSSSGVTSGSSSGATADAGETFTDLYNSVIGPNGSYGCASHHSAGNEDSFLDLGDASAAYISLVGTGTGAPAAGPKCGDGGTTDLRVDPGSPSSSLLWLKVWTLADGGNEVPCGVQMPKNPDGGETSGNPLNSTDEGKVKSWIEYGAKNN